MKQPLSILLAAVIAVSGAAPSVAAPATPRFPAVIANTQPGAIEQVRSNRGRVAHGRQWRPRGYGGYHRPGHGRYYGRHYKHRYYGRYYRPHYGYRYYDDYDDNFGAGLVVGGIFGLATGALLGGYGGYNDYYNGYDGYNGYNGSSHAAECAGKYRSYDPSSDTYMGYDGRRHRCVLP